MAALKDKIETLYHGRDARATRFRFALLTFDITTVAFFILVSMVHEATWILVIDFVVAILLVLDFAARLWIAPRKTRFMFQLMSLADLIVIVSLLLPLLIDNLAFLRVLRAMRLLRSHHVLQDLRKTSGFFARNEDILQSIVNLTVFIFVITALVYVLQVHTNPSINSYVDALYFTVTTLTTTGFGDITLEGSSGRLLSIIIMVAGISLFLRLVQTIFRPNKVSYECGTCGLKRHEPDAVHCKHCGAIVKIDTEGL